jgi:ATP-binding cassette subfamily C (CFTR/MRP) protein 2
MLLSSSSSYYAKMIKSLLRAPISFYDSTPIGKILTRFAKDITVCDLMINMQFTMTVMGGLKVCAVFITLCIVNKYMIIVFVVVLLLVLRIVGRG